MLCEVPGCNAPVRILPGVGVLCDQGHAYHTARMRTIESPLTHPHPPAAMPTPSSPIRLTFGRHKGEMLDDVPTDYIAWALGTLTELPGVVRAEMEAQLEMRSGRGIVRQPQAPRRHASTRPTRKP